MEIQATGEVDTSVKLEWGYYQLELETTHGDSTIVVRSVQLFEVAPPDLSLLSRQELLSIGDTESQGGDDAQRANTSESVCDDQSLSPSPLELHVTIESPTEALPPMLPSAPAITSVSTSITSSIPSIPSQESLETSLTPLIWVGDHTLSTGTQMPLKSSLPTRETRSGGFWIQRDQLRVHHYIRFLEGITELAMSLTGSEQDQALDDVNHCLPITKLAITELNETLIVRDSFGHFVPNPTFSFFGLDWDVPMVWLSFMDIQRYLLWCNRTLYPNTDSLWVIPSEDEWELAARGIDQRIFPWGDADPEFMTLSANHSSSPRQAHQIEESQTHLLSIQTWQELYPNDVSPFGVVGLGGGLADWTISEEQKNEHRQMLRQWVNDASVSENSRAAYARAFFESSLWRSTFQSQASISKRQSLQHTLRGGTIFNSGSSCSVTYRFSATALKRYADASMRLAWIPQCN